MKGLIQKGKKWAYQAAIPADVREGFEGKKKFQRIFKTDDPIHAERLAAEADREFRARVLELRQSALNGERMPQERVSQIVGFLFGRYFNRPQGDYFNLREAIAAEIYESGVEDQFPLLKGVAQEGLVFDQIVQQIETLLEWAEGSGYAKKSKADRPGATLIGAHEIWAKRASHTQKTKDQYKKDVQDFTEWFEEKRGQCYGAKINKRDVNQYVSFLMHKDAAKATITRALSALRLIYKVGQFSDDNPFSGVTDRMVIDGSRLNVRRFTDKEVLALLKVSADPNTRMAIRIAAYSGMRLAEITSLKIEHIERIKSGRVFNLINAGKRKTKASYRKVPIHPTIWEEIAKSIKGRDPSDYILAGEPKDKYGSRSAAISKRIARIVDIVTTDPEAREHSFRHTLISKLAEAGVRKEWRMAIVGHEGQDVHDQYTHADFLVQLSEEIAKVEYRPR